MLSMRSMPRLYSEDERGKLVGCESFASQQGRGHGTRATTIVESRYQATASEAIEDFMCAVVTVIFNSV
jgi:hypothetical protein